MQIHEKIEQARVSAGLTQDEMAEKIGIKRSTYQYWEQVTPSFDKIKKVAKALGLAEDYFFVTNDETPPLLEEPAAEYGRTPLKSPTWQDLLDREEIARKQAEATAAAHEARTEDLKAYNLFLQDIVKSSLAPILQGILETREDQAKILRFEQGLVNNMHELLKQKVARTGTGSPVKKDGAKKDTRAQN